MSSHLAQFENFQSEIIGKPPNSITRYGISFIFAFIFILMFFAWKIDYSDAITARIEINSKTPTINVASENSGIISQVFIPSDTQIQAGIDVLLMRSDSDLQAMQQLKHYLSMDDLTNRDVKIVIKGSLGALRGDYQLLANNLYQFHKVKQTLSFKLKIEQLQNDNISLAQQLSDLKNQGKLYLQKNSINQQKYNRSLELSNKNIISKNDLGQSQSGLIDVQISSGQVELEISRIEANIYNNNKQIQLYSLENHELQAELLQKIISQQQVLLDKISSWEQKYIIKAPITGHVSIPNNIFMYQNIVANQQLFSIIPHSNSLIGKVKIPENGAGKIAIGQAVDIKLDSYPFQEFGKINGTIINKSQSIHDSSLFIEIAISAFDSSTNKLTSSYSKNITYIPNMQGQVEIITKKKSLFLRIFESLVSNF
jgi:HlyD family secretion protein